MKNVRKIASEVEDIIDEYAFLLGKMDNSENFIKKAFHHSRYVSAWSDISAQLKQVKARLQSLTIMKDRYGITVEGLRGASSRHTIIRQTYLSDASYLNDDDYGLIIGNEDEAKKLTQCINDEEEERAVVSVWGMGGSAKTTLVSSIYRKREVRTSIAVPGSQYLQIITLKTF